MHTDRQATHALSDLLDLAILMSMTIYALAFFGLSIFLGVGTFVAMALPAHLIAFLVTRQISSKGLSDRLLRAMLAHVDHADPRDFPRD